MLMKCNANISIPGAMQNANVMQMECKWNVMQINAKKCIILGVIHCFMYTYFVICAFGSAPLYYLSNDEVSMFAVQEMQDEHIGGGVHWVIVEEPVA